MLGRNTPQALLAGMIPQLDHAIPIATGQQPPIGTKGHRPNFTVFVPNLEAVARLQIPQSDRPIIATCRQEPACGMKGYQPEPLSMALQDAHALATAHLP